MVRSIASPPCCAVRGARRTRLLVGLVLALAALILLPLLARGDELVTEAAFLADTLPPGGRDLNVSVNVFRSAPVLAPRLQLALALGDHAGVTADVGLHRWGSGIALDRPSGSLKVLLRAAAPDRTGVSLSLDLVGSAHRLDDTEVGAGIGLVRAIGRLTVRGALWGATRVGAFGLHPHAGVSAAVAPSPRLRVLAEVVSDLEPAAPAVAAGPAVKLAVDRSTSFTAGALFGLSAAAEPAQLFVQLGKRL